MKEGHCLLCHSQPDMAVAVLLDYQPLLPERQMGCLLNKEVFVKWPQLPRFVYAHVRPKVRMPKVSRCTSTYLDLSILPISRSLRQSVTKKQPGKALFRNNVVFFFGHFGQIQIDDGQTDGHPQSIGPQPLGLGPRNILSSLLNRQCSPSFDHQFEVWRQLYVKSGVVKIQAHDFIAFKIII